MFKPYLRFFGGFVAIVAFLALSWNVVKADVTSCDASVSPHTVSPSSSTDFTFQIDNTDTVPITWVRISRPSSNFTITANSSPGWQSTTSSRYAFQTNGTLNPGQSMTVTLTANAGASEAASANWVVHTSEQPGINIFACTGNLGTAISTASADTTPPEISNINVSNITSSSAQISWTTDEPATSEVNYGTTTGYGQTSTYDSSLNTEHSVNISGLQSNTGYHFQVKSIDDDNNTGLSSDNTFLTSSNSTPGSGGGGGSSSGGSQTDDDSTPITKVPLKEQPTENIPPKVQFTTSLDKPFDTVPKISGIVTDNEAVAGIEYSLDGGANWLPVDSDKGIGSKEANFAFTPLNLEDEDYQVVARAIDTSGNIGISELKILTIDKLPPTVGGSVLSLGPHTLQPNTEGVVYSVTGIDQKITLSAVGGATEIKAVAKSLDGKSSMESFSLTQMLDTGLWSGVISFKNPGEYNLYVEAIDGAGNKTSRVINNLFIAPAPKVIDEKDEPINANIEIFYLEPESNSWTLWDGDSYGQDNPQKANELGGFKLFVPKGKYYLKVSAPGYTKLVTDIFDVSNSSPISTTLEMKKSIGFNFGKIQLDLPTWKTGTVDTSTLSGFVEKFADNKLLEKQLPEFSLDLASGQSVKPIDLLARPTLVTLTNTWSPDSARQVAALAKLQKNPDINVLPVFLQEREGRISAFLAISGEELSWASDAEGKLASSLSAGTVPAHYFIDRKGVVKDIKYGFIDFDSIENILGGL